MNAAENYKKVCQKIHESAINCGRDPSEITLVAVTKNISWENILPVYQAGCRHFGENRLQEAISKQAESPEDVSWHFIGTLQKNKVRKAIERFVLIHSVDTPELARKIAECSVERGLNTRILLEANTSGERAKHGLSPEAWKNAFEEVVSLKGILIEGLLTMAPLVEDQAIIRQCFANLRQLRDDLRTMLGDSKKFLHLSMGMTHDFPIAVEEGATILRIGSAIFLS